MSTNSLAVFSLLCGTSLSGGLFYKPGSDEVLINPELMFYCADTTQTCSTLFGKNVFATDDPIFDRQWTIQLFPDMYNQFDDTFDCGSGSKLISMDTCAQIHQPQTLYHATGDLEVSDLQVHYQNKWFNAMDSISKGNKYFDAFFDNSVAYWVADLADYHTIWEELGADIVYLKWQIKSDTDESAGDEGKYYYSLITHNGNSAQGDGASSLSQYEIISDTFTGLDELIADGKANFIESEQRAYFDMSLENAGLTYTDVSTGCLAYPIGVRRGVSNLEENVEWYKTIFAATIVDDTQVNEGEYLNQDTQTLVKYAHIRLYNTRYAPSISFFERSYAGEDENENVDVSFGSLQLEDFEKELTSVHNEEMLSPFCGIDRWFDMHYAMDFNDLESSEKILDAIMESGNKYTLFGDSYYRFLYMPEPNGHSVQVMFETSTIEFNDGVTPNDWDPNWCPIECSDEQLSYEFGKNIVTTYGSYGQGEGKNKNKNENKNENRKGLEKEENVSANKNKNKSTHDTGLVAIGLASAIIVVLFVIFRLVFKTIDKADGRMENFAFANNDGETQRLTDTQYGAVVF